MAAKPPVENDHHLTSAVHHNVGRNASARQGWRQACDAVNQPAQAARADRGQTAGDRAQRIVNCRHVPGHGILSQPHQPWKRQDVRSRTGSAPRRHHGRHAGDGNDPDVRWLRFPDERPYVCRHLERHACHPHRRRRVGCDQRRAACQADGSDRARDEGLGDDQPEGVSEDAALQRYLDMAIMFCAALPPKPGK